MYKILHVPTGRYLFGNKTFTTNPKCYRNFESREKAQAHIDEWFDNINNEYVIINTEGANAIQT